MPLDWDEVFSYQTIKLVVVRDRRLGIIHYALQLIALGYIIFSIVNEKRYLKAEPPYGSIRATVQQPAYWGDVNELPYCNQNQASINGYTNYKCVYIMGTDVSYPPGIIDSVSVATRIKDTFVHLANENCTDLPDNLECAPNITRAPSSRYYTADPEYYTVYIEHSIFGQQNNIMLTNWQCEGSLKYHQKGKKDMKIDHSKKQGDIFLLQDLLEAADITSLDAPSQAPGNGSMRYDGALIVAVVNYKNARPPHTDRFQYYYELFHIPGVDVISMQPSYLQPDKVTLAQRNFYGVRIVFIVTGSIGYFDFVTLLQAVVAATVLLKTAAVVVDLLLLHIMPDRLTYKQHKFELTEDFGDLREERKLHPSAS